MPNKKIEDYLHLYLGCECVRPTDGKRFIIKPITLELAYIDKWQPILSPLSDMSEEEIIEAAEISDCLPYGWRKHINNFKVIELDHPNEGKEVKVTKYSFRITNVGAIYFFDYNKSLCIYAPKTPFVIQYLLSKHFDLFGLIKAGLAIDKTTLK